MAAMFAIGVHELWRRREKWLYRGGLAVLVGGTGVWSWWVLRPQRRLAARLAVDHPGAEVLVAVIALLGPWTWDAPWGRARRAWRWGWSARLPDLPRMRSSRSASRMRAADRPSGPPKRPGRDTAVSARCRTTPTSTRCLKDTQHRVVSRDRPLVERRGPRIIHRHSGHGDRRVLGQRPGADAGPVPGRRGAAQGGVLHRREQPGPRAGLGQPRSRRHREVGRGHLPVDGGGGATVYNLSAPK